MILQMVRRFDAFQQRRGGLFTFSDAPDCLMRLQAAEAPHDLELPGCRLSKGEPVTILHLWNEHMPPIPASGPGLAWATSFYRQLVKTFQGVAVELSADPRLATSRAVGGIWAILSDDETSGGVRLLKHLGFTVFPYHNPLGRFGEFWENFYSWWLIRAYNPGSLSAHPLFKLHRSEVWMTREVFMERYGSPKL